MKALKASDFEYPIFGFTHYCLYSVLFLKYHGKTALNLSIHDLSQKNLIDHYLRILEEIKPPKYIIDYLIEDFGVKGDTFFTFNVDTIPNDIKYFISDKKLVTNNNYLQHELKNIGETIDDFKDYLMNLKHRNPNIAAVHYIPSFPSKEFILSMSFVFLKTIPNYPQILREIFTSRYRIESYILRILAILEAKTFLKQSLRSAIAAIMSRNMSHNIGSHVLASTELLKGIHRDEIQKLHNFLQQRMDFIAQVVTYTPSWGEPIFFFNDLLQGFLDQYLLLGHLIKDQGYSDIKVVVHINGKEWNFKRNERQRCENENCGQPIQEGNGEKICQCGEKRAKTGRWLLQPNPNSLTDFLVAIPGGVIGAHAFYDIIENNMRNSAKYGKKTDAHGRLCNEFELHIRVEVEDVRYRITLWDNLSRRDEGEHSDKPECSCCVCKVQRSLQEDLISPTTGEVVAQSRGVHEMKECARILVYPYEEWGFQRGGKSSSLGADGIMHEGQEYLSLQFYLQKPRLVGIVSAITRNDSKAKRSGVFHYEDLQELTNHAHQFGLILMPESAEEQQKTLDFIASHHHLLPYRLLLVANNRIEHEDFKIPKRRVHWCTPNEIIWPKDDSEQDWLNFVIRTYDLWLQKFKITANGDKWQLLIAFEREKDHPAFKRWQEGLKDFNSSVMDVHVMRTDLDKKNPVVMASTSHLNPDSLTALITQNPEKWVLFDNHAKGKDLLSGNRKKPVDKSKLQFYQDFGISTLKLHQALESPPSPGFGFKFFVLGLLESALTSVLIIDERVAEATFDESKGFTQGLLVNLREAKCYPAYSAWTENQQTEERTFISDAIQRHNDAVMKSGGIHIHDEEGAYLNFSDKTVKVQRFYFGMLKTDIEERTQFDFIIIHQGVIDRLNNLNRWIKDKHISKLEEISPSIVITSGRGHTLRHVPETLPFIEFSIVRENTYAGMSKYHIVRTLFSVSGKKP